MTELDATSWWRSIPKFAYDTLRTIVDDTLGQFWPSATIPIDVEHIFEVGMQGTLIPIKQHKTATGQIAMAWADALEVTVDESIFDKHEDLARFAIAEQVATYTLYGPIFQTFERASMASWEDVLTSCPPNVSDEMRRTISDFAGLLTVPSPQLERETSGCIKIALEAGLSLHSTWDPAWKAIATKLAKRFGVPRRVIFARLRKDGLMERSRWS
jgi:hypothetical protein